MVVQNPPTSNRNDIRLVHAWRPANSSTLLWAEDRTEGTPRLLHLVRWGGELYLPTYEGMRLGLGVYNGSNIWRAYPTYVEAANLHSGGPAQPNDCTPDHMWEVESYQSMVFDAIMNGEAQRGRPLTIVAHGAGYGIGEATFGTDEYRGQIRVYERTVRSGSGYGTPTYRNAGSGYKGGGAYPGIINPEGFRETTKGGGGGFTFDPGVRSAPPTRGAPRIGTGHQVGIGAGAEEYRGWTDTSKQYHPDACLVAALRVESRQDLSEVLTVANHGPTQWFWTPSGPQWFTHWGPSAPLTAPQVPVATARPHRPSGYNSGTGY